MDTFNIKAQSPEDTVQTVSVQIFEDKKVFVWKHPSDRKVFITSALHADYFYPYSKHTAIKNGKEVSFYSTSTGGHADFNYWSGIELPSSILSRLQKGDGFINAPNVLYASAFDEGDVVNFFWPKSLNLTFEDALTKSIEKLNGERLEKFIYGGSELEPFVGLVADTFVPRKWKPKTLDI
jgi:hypothetical protein